MKTLRLHFVLFSLLYTLSTMAQQTAQVTWAINSTTTVNSSVTGDLTAPALSLNNTEIRDYAGTGTTTQAESLTGVARLRPSLTTYNQTWPASQATEISDLYIQFQVAPATGKDLSVSSIAFLISGSGASNMRACIYYSTDPTFTVKTRLPYRVDENLLRADGTSATGIDVVSQTINQAVKSGETFYVRIYPYYYNSSTVSNSKYILLRNVIIRGTTAQSGSAFTASLSTSNPSSIAKTSANVSGEITSDGGASVTERGFVWNTTGTPTTSDNKMAVGSGTGTFSAQLTGLTSDTKYYLRSYAINSVGTSYGNVVSFTTASTAPAFPGAEGFGKYTTGGRGGRVIYVTSLEDSNTEGTLRWAINQTGSRIIMFKVSGTIILNSVLNINSGDVTIAGQTAPGDGICLRGYSTFVQADNVIIRFMRFRMGDLLDINADGADAFGGRQHKNIIIDHCSTSWSTDECSSFYDNENFTMQWCIISESMRLSKHAKGPHGYGGIFGGKNASFHHNLLAHHDSRTPRFGPGVMYQGKDTVDMRNNVIYNWSGNGCYAGEAMKINIVNNFYKPGPATPTGSKRGRIIAIDKKTGLAPTDDFYPINNVWGKYFINGNYIDPATSSSSSDITVCNNASTNNWDYGVYNQMLSSYNLTPTEKSALKLEAPISAGDITTHSAQTAYEKILAYGGCSLTRDPLDDRIINETRTGTALYKGLSPYNGLESVTYPAGTVIGSTTLTVETTIDWKSSGYPKYGIIDSQSDLKPADAATDWSPWPTLTSTAAPTDTDADGMPDAWETANGLNANNPADGQLKTIDGLYPNIEVYLNSIVSDITLNQNKDAITSVTETKSDSCKTKAIYNKLTEEINVLTNDEVKQVSVFSITGDLIMLQTKKNFSIIGIPSGVYIIKSEEANGDISTNKILKI